MDGVGAGNTRQKYKIRIKIMVTYAVLYNDISVQNLSI